MIFVGQLLLHQWVTKRAFWSIRRFMSVNETIRTKDKKKNFFSFLFFLFFIVFTYLDQNRWTPEEIRRFFVEMSVCYRLDSYSILSIWGRRRYRQILWVRYIAVYVIWLWDVAKKKLAKTVCLSDLCFFSFFCTH